MMTVDSANVGFRIMPADLPRTLPSASKAEVQETSFGDTLREATAQVDTAGLDARYKISGLIEGNGTDVHDAMIAVEKADLSFQLMLQVRNKVVQAYQQIAGMQF